MSDLYCLTNDQMARLSPYFPKSHGKPRVDDRRVLNGIIFVNRNGLRWRDAPREYGSRKTLYNRWKHWGEMGVFTQMMAGLSAQKRNRYAALVLGGHKALDAGSINLANACTTVSAQGRRCKSLILVKLYMN